MQPQTNTSKNTSKTIPLGSLSREEILQEATVLKSKMLAAIEKHVENKAGAPFGLKTIEDHQTIKVKKTGKQIHTRPVVIGLAKLAKLIEGKKGPGVFQGLCVTALGAKEVQLEKDFEHFKALEKEYSKVAAPVGKLAPEEKALRVAERKLQRAKIKNLTKDSTTLELFAALAANPEALAEMAKRFGKVSPVKAGHDGGVA